MAAGWIKPLAEALADARAFRGWALRGAQRDDEDFLFALHRDAMRAYVDETWGWDEQWQRAHFAANYAPERQAVIVHGGPILRDVGRISLTRHWRKLFLRDIELTGPERNHGVGTAIINAVLALARDSDRYVELRVLRCNPAQRLYARLGFRVIDDDGARLRMRTL
ncbi:MAG TPA: GNAT family N-acetyltransferase [Casimicrobiaceae bacterium]|nr:GNAT family N-acetyltransferase [Casimicrobiaceae bacterium]